jgi:4-amino-4-deoxy-L-arabinose transferase-like glycosyltransferase
MIEATDQKSDGKSAKEAQRPQRSWLWLLTFILAVAFIGSGLFGHAPWKLHDVQTLETVQAMAESGDLIVPVRASEPAVQTPPLYYATAAKLIQRWADYLPARDAARLATGLFLAITLIFAALLGRLTWKPAETKGVGATGSMTVLVLIGTLGVVWFGHDVAADTALVAGTTMGLYGLLLVPRNVLLGGLWLGTGAGIAFLAKGLFGPAILGVTALLAPFLATVGGLERQVRGMLLGLLFAAPWLLIWPWLLYQRDPQLFDAWLWDSNVHAYLDHVAVGSPEHNLQWLWTFLIMAFPAWLLAALALVLRPGALFGLPGVRLGLLFSVVGWAVLISAEAARPIHAVLLLVPLAAIGVGGLTRMPGIFVLPLKWLAALTFGLVAAAAWALWLYLKYEGQLPDIAQVTAVLPADHAFLFNAQAYLVAAVLTVIWLWILLRYRAPSPAALLVWPAGVVMSWALLTLHQPLADQLIQERGPITGLTLAPPIVMTQAPTAAEKAAAPSPAPAQPADAPAVAAPQPVSSEGAAPTTGG